MNSQDNDAHLSGMDFFFNPRSIAIIGASANMSKLSGRPIAALLKKKYSGSIYPINPRYQDVAGLACYPSVEAVPGEIDLAVIAVPLEGTRDALRQCAEKGVKAAVVFTSGFAEVGADGKALQQEIASIARQSGMRILGPNCLGFIYFRNAVMASFSDVMEVEFENPGTLAFATQSGAFGEKTFIQALQDGVDFSAFISVGNEADLQFSDFISHLVQDKGTSLFGVYLEGAKDGLKFRQAAEAALRAGKPIMVKKVGKTGAGTRAAASHTGSLAGNDRIYDAFFRQMGIVRIEELRDFTAFARVYQCGRMPKGRNAAILTDSGGPGVDMADQCEKFGLDVPELPLSTQEKIRAIIPFYGSARNPVDMTAAIMTDQDLYVKCLQAIFDDDAIDIVFAPGVFMSYTEPTLIDETLKLYRATSKPLILYPVWDDPSPQSQEMVARFQKEGIPIIREASDAAKAVASLVRYGEKRKAFLEAGQGPDIPSDAKKKVHSILRSTTGLTEYEAKRALAAYGIPVTREELAHSADEAAACAHRIGFPVALKVQSADIPHKTEAGGIMLALPAEAEVRKAYARVMDNARAHAPDAVISGVLVQEMLPEGLEVIVGVTRDPVFGPCLMCGLGGIFVEVLQDASFRVAPLAAGDAEEMIRELKAFPVFQGLRGKPAADINALIDVILKVSQLAVDFADEIEELDINPLMVYPTGLCVADALILK